MDREYIIAGFRIRLEQADRLFVRPGSHMARAFEPFAAEADPAASLTMRLIPDCTINKELTGGEPNRELDVFPFDDAEADCHFERTPRGYLFRMVPRNGDRPTLFFKAFNSPDVQSDLLADGREPHQSLMRFGLWIMFGIAISPEAIAIHSSTIECEGRAVLFLGESGTGKSTHTRLWQEHIPGARLLNDDSPIIRMYQADGKASVLDLLVAAGLAPSKGEARRLVQQGGISVDGEKVTDVSAAVNAEALGKGIVIKKGKKVYHRITL